MQHYFIMYQIRLVYHPEPYSLTSKEAFTYSAVVQLFLRGIHSVQCSASRLAFESDRDRTLAVLILSANSRYTVEIL